MAQIFNSTPAIPILDLKEQYKQVGAEIEQTVVEILRSGSYILGKYVSRLEADAAAFVGAKHAIGVANGTDALVLALWAAGIGPGDQVITPPFTFAATAEAIMLRGATPVFVDVCRDSFNINPDLIEAAITDKTRAILPVHLYGQAADMDRINEIAGKHKLLVIEDNAQAIGASYKGRGTGTLGDMACISFYPTKNLGAAGDAGMVVTSDDVLAERLRVLRAHGMRVRYHHDELGVNSRLDEIQAAVLVAKLPHLKRWNSQRNTVARWYSERLHNLPGLVLPTVQEGNVHVWHQYTIRVVSGAGIIQDAALRDEVAKELNSRGIGSMCYYPIPLHLQKAFAGVGYKHGDFPLSEALAAQVLSLPMYPELTYGQVSRIGRELADILSSKISANVGSPVNVTSTVV